MQHQHKHIKGNTPYSQTNYGRPTQKQNYQAPTKVQKEAAMKTRTVMGRSMKMETTEETHALRTNTQSKGVEPKYSRIDQTSHFE